MIEAKAVCEDGYAVQLKNINRYKFYAAAIIAVLTFIVYLPTLGNGFVNWDDGVYIYNNPQIRFLDAGFFKWAFLDYYAGNLHPLTWISHALDYAVWGLNPVGHHLTGIALHSVNTFLVVILAVRLIEAFLNANAQLLFNELTPPPPAAPPGLTPPGSVSPTLKIRGGKGGVMISACRRGSYDTRFPDGQAVLIAAGTTGLLFGLHPLHVESVAWASERKDLLCAMFFLLSVLSYLNYKSYKTYKTYFFSLVFFALALLSKPMAMTLPAVMLILDFVLSDRVGSARSFKTALFEKLPFIALSLASAVVTVIAQKSGGAVKTLALYPLSTRVLVGFKAVVMYMWKMVFPAKLLPFYAYPTGVSITSPEYLAPVILVVSLTTVCILFLKRRPVLTSVWIYYLVTLAPMLGFIQVGNQGMADRYTYLPGLGFFLLAGPAAAWVRTKAYSLISRRAAVNGVIAVLSLSLLASLAFLTVKQIALWKDSITLWTYVIENATNRSAAPYINRGLAYREAGRPDLALADFNSAIAAEPGAADAYNNRGITLKETGRFEDAVKDFGTAIRLDPSGYISYYNRGSTLKDAGQYGPALADFDKALALNPAYAVAYAGRGLIYEQEGRPDRALEEFNAAVGADPLFAGAYVDRGLIFEQTGLPDRALADFNTAIRIDPYSDEAYNNRGLALEAMGRMDNAIEDYGKAVGLNPLNHVAYNNRGIAFSKLGRTNEAMQDFQKACELGNAAGCEALRMHQ